MEDSSAYRIREICCQENDFWTLNHCSRLQTLRKTWPYSELFWSVFSRIQTEYGPDNSEYGHFLRSQRLSSESFYLSSRIVVPNLQPL